MGTDEFSFDADSMETFTADLDACADTLRIETDKTLVKVGEIIATMGKAVAREAGSTSIPPTIKTKPGEGFVEVTAGSKDVPLAALWDEGNRGRGKGKLKTFWHPVYGNRTPGATQPRHKVLKRARTLARPTINALMTGAWTLGLAPLYRGGNDDEP